MTRTQAAFGVVAVLCVSMVMLLAPQRSAEAVRDDHAVKIATVDLMALLEDGLGSTEFAPERIAKRDELAARVTTLETDIRRLETELRMTPQNDPRGQQLFQQYQAKQQEYQQVAQAASSEFQRFSASQTTTIFNRVRGTAIETARSMGYTHVLGSRGEIEPNEEETLATITQEVLARSVLMAPSEHDITEEVRAALGFELMPDETTDADDAEADDATEMP